MREPDQLTRAGDRRLHQPAAGLPGDALVRELLLASRQLRLHLLSLGEQPGQVGHAVGHRSLLVVAVTSTVRRG